MTAASSKPVLLLGKEKFLKREFLKDLRASLFGASVNASLNFQEFSAKKKELHAAIDFISTVPFLSEKRMAVLWEIDECSDTEGEVLLSAIERLLPSSVLVMSSDAASSKKSGFLSGFSEHCQIVPCHTPFENQIGRWVEGRARKAGKQISREAVTLLTDRIGRDLSRLDSTLEQLSLFADPRNEITARDVEDLIGATAEEDLFRLADTLVRGRTEQALRSLDHFFEKGLRSVEIIAALASQLEKLKAGIGLLKKGHSPQEIGMRLRVHSFYLERFMGELRAADLTRIERLLKEMLACDQVSKTGKEDERLALEKFILTTSLSREN